MFDGLMLQLRSIPIVCELIRGLMLNTGLAEQRRPIINAVETRP